MKTVSVAAQYKLPAVYFERFFVRAQSLVKMVPFSCGPAPHVSDDGRAIYVVSSAPPGVWEG
jgi:hypothetical protein